VKSVADLERNKQVVVEPGKPDNPGRALADFFRLVDGRIVEHWDVIQDVPTESANDNGMF
jgi:predicted SnoaL-like aldol condensation-catalyzing enzyme